MNTISNIIPIFAVIILGLFARKKGFIPEEFIGPANRLVYYLAIPAMIFSSTSKASLKTQFDAVVLVITLASVLVVFAAAGILFSLTGFRMPTVVDRSLDILSSLALPMALLVIGASLTFKLMQSQILRVLSPGFLKLVLLPGCGFLLFRLFDVSVQNFLPGLILLASPSATVTYVMAKEMGGDADFAVAAISTSTMLSSITFSVWL